MRGAGHCPRALFRVLSRLGPPPPPPPPFFSTSYLSSALPTICYPPSCRALTCNATSVAAVHSA